ncbi:MAG: hypothetical protein CM15mV10_2220 [uncultured marine virus]|nr:MAG: hypothetical protein CM15mV10_2220 [uncultured marine virus]
MILVLLTQGLSQLFGLDSFGPHGFSPMGLIGNIADSMGFGGLFRTITGMMGGGGGDSSTV